MRAVFLAKVLIFAACFSLPVAVLYAGSRPEITASSTLSCTRIVSLAPSITEVLFDLELGDNIVGVTRYCVYPPAARNKPKIGGFFDINLEAIMSERPSVIFALSEHAAQRVELQKLGLKVVTLEHKNVSGIISSIQNVGALCGREEQAKRLRTELEERIEGVQQRVRNQPKVRVMIVVGGAGPGSLYVSGKDGFYSELLSLAGGENVYQGLTTSIPTLSVEGLLKLDPNIIIEITTDPEMGSQLKREDSWQQFPGLRAVKNGQIYVIDDDYVSVPGPRFVKLLEKIAALIHP